MELHRDLSKLWGCRLLAGSRHVLWSATEAVGTNALIAAVRGFAKHYACCRDGQGKGTLADLFQMFFF